MGLDVAVVFLASRLVFYLVAGFISPLLPLNPDHLPTVTGAGYLIDASWRWDGTFYLSIAEGGYSVSPDRSNVAFFPLYPMAMRAFDVIVPGGRALAGVLVSHLCFLGGLAAVWMYAARFGDRTLARRTIVLLASFPTAFFFSAGYTESLFLVTSACTVLLIHQRRFVGAGVVGAFAAATRFTGLFLALPAAIAAWKPNGPSMGRAWRLAASLLIVGGTLAYAVYLAAAVGDPLAFVKAQGDAGRQLMWPGRGLIEALRLAFTAPTELGSNMMGLVNVPSAVGALGLAWLWIRRDLGAAVYCLASLAVPLLLAPPEDPSRSLARFVVVLFPLFVPLALWARSRLRLGVLLALFVPLQIALTALFVRGFGVI